jgi:ATP-dependent Clp protease ATP-binding subunit ClpA
VPASQAQLLLSGKRGIVTMLDLEIFTDKIAGSGRQLIRAAYTEAKRRDHNQFAPEHILVSIINMEPSLFNEVMQSLNLDPQVVLQALETKLGQREYFGRSMRMSESFRTLLSNALKHSHESGRRVIESADLFVALFKDRQGFSVKLFKQLGADNEMVVQKIHKQIRSRKPSDSQPQDNHRGHQQ